MAKAAKEKKTRNIPTKVKKTAVLLGDEYNEALAQIKRSIQEAQVKAAIAATHVLTLLYWSIGQTIAEKQEKNKWGF